MKFFLLCFLIPSLSWTKSFTFSFSLPTAQSCKASLPIWRISSIKSCSASSALSILPDASSTISSIDSTLDLRWGISWNAVQNYRFYLTWEPSLYYGFPCWFILSIPLCLLFSFPSLKKFYSILVVEHKTNAFNCTLLWRKNLNFEFFQKLIILIQKCHRHGVAHIDLKGPSNMLIDECGNPHLIE